VAAGQSGAWRLIAAESSYQRFLARADDHISPESPPLGSLPDVPGLLSSASKICGRPIDLVAIDMPLARSPILGRRTSDRKVSSAYGARKCGTHSPSALRPGRISDDLRKSFENAGYPLLTEKVARPGLIEVYPHPALVELANAPERLPYKAAKLRKYWPSDTKSHRRARLFSQWSVIVALLEAKIAGVMAMLPGLGIEATGIEVKAYEDALDAVICAWVAICALEERARPFGDADSAIWIPISEAQTGV
jgi:predicted RNase H-like nuclease